MSKFCPEHGKAVHDLALGRLADEDALVAEALLSSCADCRSWWSREIECDSFQAVDKAVAGVVRGFEPPRRTVNGNWATLAAAAILAIAVGVVLQVGHGPGETSQSVQPGSQSNSIESGLDGLLAEGFESESDLVETEGLTLVGLVGDESTAGNGALDHSKSAEMIFADGVEGGELISWSDKS